MRRFLVLVLLGSRVSADSYLADPFEETKSVANGHDSGDHKALAWQMDDKFGQIRGSSPFVEKPYAPVDVKETTKANAPWRASTSEKASESSPTVNQPVGVSSVVVPWSTGTSTKSQTDDHQANAEGGAYKSDTTSSAVKAQPVLGNNKTQTSTDAVGQVVKASTPSKVNESQAIVPRDANKTSADVSHEEKTNFTSANSSSPYRDKPSSSPVNDSSTPDSVSTALKHGVDVLSVSSSSKNRTLDSIKNSTGAAITPAIERNETAFVDKHDGEGMAHDSSARRGDHSGGGVWNDGRKNQDEQQPGDHSGPRDTNVTSHEEPITQSKDHPAASSREKVPASYGGTVTSEQKSPSHGSKHEGGVEVVIVPWRRGTLDTKNVGNEGETGNGGTFGVGAKLSGKNDEKHEYGAVLHDEMWYAPIDNKTEDSKAKSRLPSSPESNPPPDKTSDLYDLKTSSTSKKTTSNSTERNATANAQYGEQPSTEKAKSASYPAPEEVKQGGNVATVDVPWESRVSKPSDSKAHVSESAYGGDLGRSNNGKPQLTRDYTVDKPQGYVLDNVVPWSEQHSLIARGLQSEPEGQQTGEYPVEESNENTEATEGQQQPVESNGEQSVKASAAANDKGAQTGELPVEKSNEPTEATQERQPVESSGEPRIEESSENAAAKDKNQQTGGHPVEESGGHTEATEGEQQPTASSIAAKDESQQPAERTGGQAAEVSNEVKDEDQQPAEQTVGVSGEPAQVQEEGERPSDQPSGNATEIKDGVMTTMIVSEENVRWDQDDCDPCEVPTQPPTLAPIYPRGDDDFKKYLPNVTETTESWKDLTENLPPRTPTKTPKTSSPDHDEFIHCTKIIGNYGEIYECTANATAPPTPAPTQPQPDKTCIDVSVEGDATYCIEGSICSGSGSFPAGFLCPVKGDVAVKDCWGDTLPSWTSVGTCVAPVNATCARIKTGAWGCVYGEPSKATDTPATETPTETSSGTPTVTEAPTEPPYEATPAPTVLKTEAPTEPPYEATPAPTVPKTEAPEATLPPTVPKTEAPTEPPYGVTPAPTVPKAEGPEATPSPTVPKTATPGPTPAVTKSSESQKPTPAPSQPYGATPAPTKISSQPTPTPAVTTTREGTIYPTTTGTTKPATSTTTEPEAATSTPGTSTGNDAYANTGTSGADANNAVGASTSKGTASTSSSGLSTGAIAGIVIACIVFAAFIVGAVLYKQRSIARQREENLFADLSATGGRPLETDYAAM